MKITKKVMKNLMLITLIGLSFFVRESRASEPTSESPVTGGLTELIKALQDLIAADKPIALSDFPALNKIALGPFKDVLDQIVFKKATLAASDQAFILAGYAKMLGQDVLIKLRFATVLIPGDLEVLNAEIDNKMAMKANAPARDELPEDEFRSRDFVMDWYYAMQEGTIDLSQKATQTLVNVASYLTNLNNPVFTDLLAIINDYIKEQQIEKDV